MFRSVILPLLLCFTFINGCSSSLKDTNTAEGGFQAGEEYEKDEMWEEALQKYAEVKNKFPYSRFAVEAELRIADIHYKRENWIDAQNAYQLFKDLHPKHAKISYVTYRLAMSFYQQLPSTIDRDLTVAEKAILYYDDVIKNHPTTEYVTESKEKRIEARKMLAEKIDYIGNFYYIRDTYDSAMLRYEHLYHEFGKDGWAPKALLRAGICALEIGERNKGTEYLNKLIQDHGSSPEADDARSALGKYGVH